MFSQDYLDKNIWMSDVKPKIAKPDRYSELGTMAMVKDAGRFHYTVSNMSAPFESSAQKCKVWLDDNVDIGKFTL